MVGLLQHVGSFLTSFKLAKETVWQGFKGYFSPGEESDWGYRYDEGTGHGLLRIGTERLRDMFRNLRLAPSAIAEAKMYGTGPESHRWYSRSY